MHIGRLGSVIAIAAFAGAFLMSGSVPTATASTTSGGTVHVFASGDSEGRQVVGRTEMPLSSSICTNVSAASVSAIIGYTVPKPTSFVQNLKPTKKNFGISAVDTSCTFGAETSLATIVKDVTLSLEITSRALTASEIMQQLAATEKSITITSYSGLGVPAMYFKLTAAGLTGQGIFAIFGTKIVGASVESKTVSKSTLASLVKLAEKL